MRPSFFAVCFDSLVKSCCCSVLDVYVDVSELGWLILNFSFD